LGASEIRLPAAGRSQAEVLGQLERLRERDVDWQAGKVFSLVFYAGQDVSALAKEAYGLFFAENALNPSAFPSLRRLETEVIAMTARLLGSSGEVVGNMTSGGTESILMAVKTARDWARANRPRIRQPEIVIPVTAHPAFEKAAHYFDLRVVHVPVDAGFQADLGRMHKAISRNTIMLVGSAPAYPHGVIDPIPAIARLAEKHKILCHVDACVGGFFLPFARAIGHPVAPFDFAVPGVTSLSVDLHKYGYAAKGASVVLYRSAELRRHQLFVYADWPGGIYASPTMAGTRPGGAIAAAWAVMQYLGQDGYERIAGEVMRATATLRAGIAAIPGLTVLGDPAMSVLALAASDLNIYEVGDELARRGWHLDRQQSPPSLHLTVNFVHTASVEQFLADLRAASEIVRAAGGQRKAALLHAGVRLAATVLPRALIRRLARRATSGVGGAGGGPERSAAMYGMMGALPDRSDLNEAVLDIVEQFTLPQDGAAE
jgi:glutamate/tyrosine decarboxylase-like PLP-dependent enzyme